MAPPPLTALWTSSIMKKPAFRVSLQYNIQKYKNGSRDWFNKITENVYLGAIPLTSSSASGKQGILKTIPKS